MLSISEVEEVEEVIRSFDPFMIPSDEPEVRVARDEDGRVLAIAQFVRLSDGPGRTMVQLAATPGFMLAGAVWGPAGASS
jgi:hypothetical protein